PDAGDLGIVDLGLADYTDLSGLQATLTDSLITEGDSTTINGSFTDEVKPHVVTITWGDGVTTTILPSEITYDANTGLFAFTATHFYTDDPAGAVTDYAVTVTVEESD